jgi:hypothetical protein
MRLPWYLRCEPCIGSLVALYHRDISTGIEAGVLPRRRPRRKGVCQSLSESELDGILAMLGTGASILEIHDAYDMGLAMIAPG